MAMVVQDPWQAVVEKLIGSPNETLFSARLRNYYTCAAQGQMGPGGVWSADIVADILEKVRESKRCPWPVPPAMGGPDDNIDDFLVPNEVDETMGVEENTGFSWTWLVLPIPWLDDKGTSAASFPLPIAKLAEDIGGHGNVINATALWHLLPNSGGAGHLFRASSPLWPFATRLGIECDSDLVPSDRGRTWRAKAGQPAPAPGSLADRLAFGAFMASPRLLLAALT